MKRLLVVQNAVCEHLGTLQAMFESDNFEINTLIPVSGHKLPSSIHDYNALVILGGPASVYGNHQYLIDEQILMRDAMAKKIPTLGICLGSQLIARASGGNVYKGVRKEIGWYTVELTEHGMNDIFKGLERKINVFQWHGDTYDLPENAVILAKSDLYPVQAFRVGSAIGVQFHLEVSKDMVMEWMEQYSTELESANNYINKDDIIDGLDTNLETLNAYTSVLYRNFRELIK